MAAKKRFTIGFGFLAGYIRENYSSGIFKGVQQACEEAGLNFIGFESGFSRVPAIGLHSHQKNSVIDLIDQSNLDGMILLSEHTLNYMTDEEVSRIFRNLSGVPIVGIGRPLKNAVSVLIDNKKSMRELIGHLIEEHGYRRIAFINGPDTSYDGKERFEAYREALREHGLEIEERLIVPNGDFYASGTEAVKTLLDERNADIDAIVAANDWMAIFAAQELDRRGIKIPGDVAVTGFDDCEYGRLHHPSLTTIRQSLDDLGRESVNAMRALLDGEHVPRRIVVPTRLLLRESCGCTRGVRLDRILSRRNATKAETANAPRGGSPGAAARAHREFEKTATALFEHAGGSEPVTALARELPGVGDEAGRRKFLERIEGLYIRLFERGEMLETVWRFTDSFFAAAADGGDDQARRDWLNDLCKESLLLAGLSVPVHQDGRNPGRKGRAPVDAAPGELVVNQDFSDRLHLDQLRETVGLELRKMPIKGFFVCLYEDSTRTTAKLLLQRGSDSGDRPMPDRAPFPVKQLVPGLTHRSRRYAYLVVSLFYNENNFGYIVIDIHDLVIDPVLDGLAVQMSNAVHSAMQAKAIGEYALHLEEKVMERTRQLEYVHGKRAEFFNVIVHEIKNPLTIIGNYLDAYIGTHGPSDELATLKSNFEAVIEVMEDYLSRESLERGRIVYRHDQTADFSEIVRNDAILFRESARRKDIRLTDEIEQGVFVAGDPEALERIVGNLLQNAVRFTKPGGRIEAVLRRKANQVEFSVSDTGIGLSPEERERVFDRYYQANAAGEAESGSGLGLYIVKRIIDEVGAEIRVTGEKGKGSTFTCLFAPAPPPGRVTVARRKRAAPEAAQEAGDAFRTDRGNVLLVDDNVELQAYLAGQMKDAFNVFQAFDGLDALEKLKRIPKPDIIVSDVLMEKMDGFRFFEELMKHENFRDIPFLFLTAAGMRAERLRALHQGAVDYISKPFHLDELIAKIRSNLRIQEALKKKNILFLSSKVYRAFESELRKYEDDLSGIDSDHLSRLHDSHGIARKEIEVISLLRLGLPHKQIASRLNISINTLRTYLARIYRKFNVNSSLELFAKLKSL